jgi:hypothetical protein
VMKMIKRRRRKGREGKEGGRSFPMVGFARERTQGGSGDSFWLCTCFLSFEFWFLFSFFFP